MRDDWKTKVIVLPEPEFRALPEYSCSVPSGVVVGKRWRRHEPYRRAPTCDGRGDCGHWLLGEYVADDGMIAIAWTPLTVRSTQPLPHLSPRRASWCPEED